MINANSTHPIGNWCNLNKVTEVTDLKKGMDFRMPKYRREVFMRFYEFHLQNRSHPGGVYFMLPWLQKKYDLDHEQMLWMTFINGMSQHIVTTWMLFEQFPTFRSNPDDMQKYIRDNWAQLGWDMDRRYVKNKFGEALECYQKLIGEKTQTEYWNGLCNTSDDKQNFRNCWTTVMDQFHYFGRLSSFSYLEYQRIIGLNIDCDRLFLEDMSGSKSHRNGLAVVLGRDDLDWHDKLNPDFQGYRPDHITWLQSQGESLLIEAQERFKDKEYIRDVSYFTLESTLCCYKSWHRKNRRYPNVYMDMFHDRIKKTESASEGKYDCSLFWNARKESLPEHLLLECVESDPGLCPEKQNHYRDTGQVIMMDKMWSCFENDFNIGGLKNFL
jgi:hypothetical protein